MQQDRGRARALLGHGAHWHKRCTRSCRRRRMACKRIAATAYGVSARTGSPLWQLTVVVSEAMNGSMCGRRSSADSDAMSGAMAARYRPKCANLVARLLTVLATQVAFA